MVNKVEAYGCNFCSMVSRRKSSVSRHEKKSCRKNPNRSTCLGCINFEHALGYTSDDPYIPSEAPIFWCAVKEINLDPHTLNATIECEYHKPRPK